MEGHLLESGLRRFHREGTAYGPQGVRPSRSPGIREAGCCRGQLSVSLAKDKSREVTLYHLEVLGPQRRGEGRAFLQWLKRIFKGGVYVEDAGIQVRNASSESLLFWVKMFREGHVQAVEGESLTLHRDMSQDEIDRVEEELRHAGVTPDQGAA